MAIGRTSGTRRSIQKKLSMATLIQLSIVFCAVFIYLPFIDVRMNDEIYKQRNMGMRLKDKEVATIAKFISFEFGRMEKLNDIKLAYFNLQSKDMSEAELKRRDLAIRHELTNIQSFLWEQCTFNPEVVYVDLVAVSRGRILNVTPFVGESNTLKNLSELDSTNFPEKGKERYGEISRLILYKEFVGERPSSQRDRLLKKTSDFEYYLMPLYVGGSYWGIVRMVISTKDINRQIDESVDDKKAFRDLSGTVFVCIMILGYIAGLYIMNFLGRQITAPILKLTTYIGEYDETLDTREIEEIKVDKDDEVGVLKETFLDMSKSLRESQNQLQKSAKMATLGEMGATVAHEINNRLGLGSLAAQELMMHLEDRDTIEKDKVVKTMKKIIRSFERCSAFATKFKNFARPQKEAYGPLSLNETVEDIMELIKKRLDKAGVEMSLALGEVPLIWGNKSELEQVLINLIFNAQDAIVPTLNDDKTSGTIIIRTYGKDDKVLLEIQDDGIGMNKETIEKLFTPFFTTKELKGTGLGLSICDGILKTHNAKIDVKSEPGEGATFTISFPVLKERG